MRVEPEIEMPEHEPMRPRHLRVSDEMRRRARREVARRRRIRERRESACVEDEAPL